MNKDFSRNITLLRKERKLTQKQAATELGISQALLSHYEKGIRECSLDFVVKAADYYNVSCDYLLGRTADRDYDISEPVKEKTSLKQSTAQIVNRRLIASMMNVIYDFAATANGDLQCSQRDLQRLRVCCHGQILYRYRQYDGQGQRRLSASL